MHRNIEIDSVMLDSIPIQLSNNHRNLGFVLDNQLSLKYQNNIVKRKVIVDLNNISRIARFIDKNSKMKLVHELDFSINDFCNTLYYHLPNIINCLQMLINSAV